MPHRWMNAACGALSASGGFLRCELNTPISGVRERHSGAKMIRAVVGGKMGNTDLDKSVLKIVRWLLIGSIVTSVVIVIVGLIAGEQFEPSAIFFMMLWLGWAIFMLMRIK